MKTIVFTGGGTAGHIMPNIAILDELKDYKVYYMGTNGMEKSILLNHPNITFVEIPAVKLVRSLTPKNLLIPFKLIKSISQCKKELKKINPNIIFSKGGFVSIPVALAGSKLKIPILTHESDLTIGLANKIIAKHAKYLCCSFPETSNNYGRNSIYTGTPLRSKIYRGQKKIVLARHNLNSNKPIVLIVGGSQGAKSINQVIFDNIDKLSENYTIIHIVGKNNKNPEIKAKDYVQLEFVNDIENYFDASDIVISRAGSNTIFELLSLTKPMLLIPLSKANSRGDQLLNAQNFQQKGYAEVILQENFNINSLIITLRKLTKNKSYYQNNMQKSANTNGTKTLIKLINDCSLA